MKPWSQLTLDEQRAQRVRMNLCGGYSVNGVAGWYAAQRTMQGKPPRKKPTLRPVVRFDGVSLLEEAPEPLEIEDIKDVLPH